MPEQSNASALGGTSTPADASAPSPASAPSNWLHPPWLAGRRFATAVLIVCVLGLIARALIVYQFVTENPLAGTPRVDAKTYWDWAGRISEGKLIGDHPFFSAPLYPYLLGVVRALGGGLVVVYAIQAMLDVLTAALLAAVGRRRFGPLVGLVGAIFFLLLMDPASFSLRVLTCSLQLLLLTAFWHRMLIVQERPTLRELAVLGVLAGLVCLAYAPAMILLAVLAPWLFLESKRRLHDIWRALMPVGIAALMIALATLHNWIASDGDLFLIQSVSSVNLRQGNQPQSVGVYTVIPGTSNDRDDLFKTVADEYRLAKGREGTWSEIHDYYLDQVVDFWNEDPSRTVGLVLSKMYWFLTGRIYGDIAQPVLERDYAFGRMLWLAPIPTPWLIGPALLGLFALLRRPVRYAPELLLFAIPFLIVSVFWYSPRYRLPATPVIVIVCAWALLRALQWRRHPAWAFAAAVLLAASIATGPLNRRTGFDVRALMQPIYEVSVAITLEEEGRTAEAKQHYLAAIEVRPDEGYALSRLAELALAAGDVEQAIEYTRRTADAIPQDARWRANLGGLLAGRDDQAAVLQFERALSQDPSLMAVHREAGLAYLRLGKFDRAAHHFRVAANASPGALQLRFGLANALWGAGRRDEAVAEYHRILELQPGQPHAARALAWILATEPDPEPNDAAEAVRLAKLACRGPGGSDPLFLDALAAAYAAAGRFSDAAKTAEQAVELAKQQGRTALAGQIQSRLELYRNSKPYRITTSGG